MGYHVKIEELLEVQSQMLNQLSEWGTQLETVYQALETIVVTPCIQGETGKSIQNYIQEVHIPVIGSLQQLLTEFQVRLSVYAEGYYGIDSSYEAEIPQEILEEQQKALENGREDFENLREEINSIISSVSDIVSVAQPSGLSLVLSYQLMESRVKTLNSDIGDYEQTHQNDTQNMDSMMETIRSILIARTGSPAVSVTNYQAGSIAKIPAYQRLQIGCEASESYVAQNIAQYEAAMKKFEDKMNDKLADDRKAEGLKQLLAGIVSVTVGTALIFATAGAAAPIVFGAAVVGGTSTLYGLSNATEGMNNISLGFSGDGFTVAENPIRDTLFAGNPELYYTIGNASTMISAMALPMSGILKGATGATKFKAIAVDGGRILIGNVAEDKVYDVIYQSTDSRILAMLGSNVVEGILSGKPANSSVSEIGDVARKTHIEEIGHRIQSERESFTSLRDLMSPEEVARYNKYWINVAENISNEALDYHITYIKSGGIRKPGGGKYQPSKVSATVDLNNGNIYFGYNGSNKFNPSKIEIHPDLQERIDFTKKLAEKTEGNRFAYKSSFEIWNVENCAEVHSVNNALQNGASLDNIFINTKVFRNGEYAPPCKNCEITFKGINMSKGS